MRQTGLSGHVALTQGKSGCTAIGGQPKALFMVSRRRCSRSAEVAVHVRSIVPAPRGSMGIRCPSGSVIGVG